MIYNAIDLQKVARLKLQLMMYFFWLNKSLLLLDCIFSNLIGYFQIADYIKNKNILTTTNVDVNYINTIISNNILLYQNIFLFRDIIVFEDDKSSFGIVFQVYHQLSLK